MMTSCKVVGDEVYHILIFIEALARDGVREDSIGLRAPDGHPLDDPASLAALVHIVVIHLNAWVSKWYAQADPPYFACRH